MTGYTDSHFVLVFFEAVCEGSSCGLVDHSQYIETSDLTCILSSLGGGGGGGGMTTGHNSKLIISQVKCNPYILTT